MVKSLIKSAFQHFRNKKFWNFANSKITMMICFTSAKGGVGKTTSAIHTAGYLAKFDSTVLIDGDPNRSSLKWASRGELPFKVVDLMAAPKHMKHFEHCVFDTPARPSKDDLEALIEGFDLLVIPTIPDVLSIEASLDTVDVLTDLNCKSFKLLLTIVPPKPRKSGEIAREALSDYPMFKQGIRRFAAYEAASLQGCLVNQVRGDKNSKIAASDYEKLGREIL